MDSGHLSALNAKHAGLEQRLKTESARPLPDTALVATLKKQKLAIKEELQNLTH
ncbi:MAG: YdcH family protein [Sphingobium sp.]